MQCLSTLFQQNTATVHYCNSTLLQEYTATVHCNSTLQQYTATAHCNSTLQLYTATVYCNSTLQQYTATVYCNRQTTDRQQTVPPSSLGHWGRSATSTCALRLQLLRHSCPPHAAATAEISGLPLCFTTNTSQLLATAPVTARLRYIYRTLRDFVYLLIRVFACEFGNLRAACILSQRKLIWS